MNVIKENVGNRKMDGLQDEKWIILPNIVLFYKENINLNIIYKLNNVVN
jgi:hypothetical protein